MDRFKQSQLWINAFSGSNALQHADLTRRLVSEFEKTRSRADTLTGEIAADLPGYTVHGIHHLDALWEIASQIAGSNFTLNPVEAYVLGNAFLLHDAGMTVASYPGGIKEIKQSKQWKKLSKIASFNGQGQDDNLIGEFIRTQHASRARQLPTMGWTNSKTDSSYFLIEDSDFRDQLGDFIGIVAESHWWDHDKLERELSDRIVPVPAPFPSDWSVDLLVLTCIMRTADAAQIDNRRAPGFLFALRSPRLDGLSKLHWGFQNKLTQGQRREDGLYFASFRSFKKEESGEWWLMFDTLTMVDRELRKTDNVLARHRPEAARLAARRVVNADSPTNLQVSVPTEGWDPIDTALSIKDIPSLVENLGGASLYGSNNFAAIRELIQNAMDAVRLRRAVDPSFQNPLVTARWRDPGGAERIIITDNGIGMSQSGIIEKLLAFGTSGWRDDDSIAVYSDELPTTDEMSGRFGIGFFSIFMLGDDVLVKSRRFDASPRNTLIVEFPAGLKERPLMSRAIAPDLMTEGGTEISVRPISKGHGVYTREHDPSWPPEDNSPEKFILDVARTFPASDVPIHIEAGELRAEIDGRAWITEDVQTFLKRVEGKHFTAEDSAYEKYVSPIVENGRIVGRACIFPGGPSRRSRWVDRRLGAVICQGAYANGGAFRGVLLGKPMRAARDYAQPIASSKTLSDWASAQAILLASPEIDPGEQMEIASIVAGLGGDIGNLKICELAGRNLSVEDFRQILRARDFIYICNETSMSLAQPDGVYSEPGLDTVSVGSGTPMFIDLPYWTDSDFDRIALSLDEIIQDAVIKEFGIADDVVQFLKERDEDGNTFTMKVPAWTLSSGEVITVRGIKFSREMKLDDLLSEQIDE